MGNTQSTELAKEGELLNIIDFIASDFILTQNFKDMLSLTKEDYCNKLLILTSKVISKYLSGLEINHLVKTHINGEISYKNDKNKILYLHKNDLDKLDDLDEEAKQGMCNALSTFYVKIAHVFASITASINPTYTYNTRAGKKLTFNTLNRGEMDKYNIARSEEPKVEFVSFCGRRVDCLSSGLDIDSLTDPKETFTIQPGFCSVNKNKDGTVRDLFDEPGMAEIKQLYYDKMDDKTKKYTGMSEQAEKDYKERLVKFWKLLSDKPPPNDLTYMSQITLRQFHNERGCHATVESGKQGFQKSHYRTPYEGTLEDKLFKDYVDNIKDIMQTSLEKEKILMTYLDSIFEGIPHPVTGKTEVTIKSDLTDDKLNTLLASLRNDQLDMYLDCEEKFLKGFKIFEQIVSARLIKTAQMRSKSLSEQQRELEVEHPEIKEIYTKTTDKPKSIYKEDNQEDETYSQLTKEYHPTDDDMKHAKQLDKIHTFVSPEELHSMEKEIALQKQEKNMKKTKKQFQDQESQFNKDINEKHDMVSENRRKEMLQNINEDIINTSTIHDSSDGDSDEDSDMESPEPSPLPSKDTTLGKPFPSEAKPSVAPPSETPSTESSSIEV